MGKKTIELLIIFTENVTLLQASTLWKRIHKTQLRKQFYSQARGNRACRTTFGGASPASEALLVVKQPKQFQLQDVFNIFLSISDLFPSSLDYTSQKVLLCYHVTYSMPPFLNSPLTSSDNYWLYIFKNYNEYLSVTIKAAFLLGDLDQDQWSKICLDHGASAKEPVNPLWKNAIIR